MAGAALTNKIMKNTLIAILTITTIALGTAGVLLWRKLDDRKTEAASLRAETERQAQQVSELEAAEQLAQKRQSEALEQANNLAAQLQARPRAVVEARAAKADADSTLPDAKTDKAKDKAGFGNMLQKMMDDPEMRKMIRDQQSAVLDQLYNPLAKQLNLTPEEAEQFKDLLADNMMKSAEKASSLFGGDSATNRTEAIATLAENQKTFEETMRGFLGESRYQQYQEYQQTVGERSQLNQFQLQNGSGENALTDGQVEKLLGIMREEKQSVAAATGQPVPGNQSDAASVQEMFSGDGAEKVIQYQETVNKQVLGRAKDVLSATQLDAFEKFQANQLKMMRMGMSMAQKMMSADKPAQP